MTKQTILRVMAAIVVMLAVCISVQAQAPTGKYNLASVEGDDGSDWTAFFTMMGFDLSNFHIEFQGDGKCIVSIGLEGETEAKEATYKVDGKNIIFSTGDPAMPDWPAIFEDDKIIIEQAGDPELGSPGMKMVFQKK